MAELQWLDQPTEEGWWWNTTLPADTLALLAEVKRLRTIVSGVIFNAARISRMVNDRATEPGRDPPPMSGPVWSAVAEITGNGSTRACELCREFGVDPTTGEALQPPTESE